MAKKAVNERVAEMKRHMLTRAFCHKSRNKEQNKKLLSTIVVVAAAAAAAAVVRTEHTRIPRSVKRKRNESGEKTQQIRRSVGFIYAALDVINKNFSGLQTT